MRHLALTTKRGDKVLVHVDDLKEAYPAADRQHTVCVIRVADRDKADTFLIVNESTDAIEGMMRSLTYKGE